MKEKQIQHLHVHVHTQMHDRKVYDRGAFLRKVLYVTLKLRFENISNIILKLNFLNFLKQFEENL
jgi:hypothetical protein